MTPDAPAVHMRLGRARTNGEDMQNREHSCFFSAAHAAKGSRIALQLAHNLSLELPPARATKEQYDRTIGEGLGDLDKSGIAEFTFKGRHNTPAITFKPSTAPICNASVLSLLRSSMTGLKKQAVGADHLI